MVKSFNIIPNPNEINYLVKYAGNGVLNTALGLIIIFAAMEFGYSPIISNSIGYLVGLIVGFLTSKKVIFKSDGYILVEGLMYFFCFILAFLFNFVALYLMLNFTNWHALPSQILSGGIFSMIMYLLSRYLIFSSKKSCQTSS